MVSLYYYAPEGYCGTKVNTRLVLCFFVDALPRLVPLDKTKKRSLHLTYTTPRLLEPLGHVSDYFVAKPIVTCKPVASHACSQRIALICLT